MKSNFYYQPILLTLAIIVGFGLSFYPNLANWAGEIEEPLLSILLFLIFLEINFASFTKAFKNYRFLITALLINFVWTPIFAIILSRIFLSESISLQIALITLLIMPCTDWYLIFTDLSGGDVELSSALLPFNLSLQLLLFPIIIGSLFGFSEIKAEYTVDWTLFISFLVPFVLAILTKLFFKRMKKWKWIEEVYEKYHEKSEFLAVILIALCIFISNGQMIFDMPNQVIYLILAMLCFYVINFLLGFYLSKIEKFNDKEAISLIFTITSRNTPLSLSLASLLFPHDPVIALCLLIGPLSEIPVSLTESFILRKIFA